MSCPPLPGKDWDCRMIEDLAMGLMELVMNSITAGARHIWIVIRRSLRSNLLTLEERDDGCGMDPAFAKRLTDPFTTTRTTRRIGMGTALMQGTCQLCGGKMDVASEKGKGTTIVCTLPLDSIDLPPMGNIGEVVMDAMQAAEGIDYDLLYQTDASSFHFTTRELRTVLGDEVSLQDAQVLLWVRDYINQQISQIEEGKV